MRPISLTLESFGSYLKKTEIDFTKVSEPIFLITGDTGAGKSTVFDAIVFALYGKSSSANGKEGLDFKSQYGDKKPEVTFKFQKNNKEYIVKRSFREVKKSRNGVKTLGTSTKLSLTLPDNTEFLGKVPDIEAKIEEIIGLTKDQFMQIAMIAQGEFMALLRAKSDNKKEIFRKLFHTEKFAKIIEIIKEKRRNIKIDVERAESLCKKDISRINISDNKEILNLQEQIISGKNINIVLLENFLKLLEENLKQSENEKSALIYEVKSLKKERDVLKENFTKNEELKKNFDLLNSEEETLKNLLSKTEEMKSCKKLSEEIVKSYEIKDKFDVFDKAVNKINLLKANLKREEEKSPILKKEFSKIEKELKEAESVVEKELPKVLETIENAKKALKIFDESESIKKELKILQNELQKEEVKKSKLKIEAEKLKKECEIKKEELEKLKGIDGRREKLKYEEEELNKFITESKELKSHEEKIRELNEKIKKMREDYNKKKAEFEKSDEEYRTKENMFFDSQAGVLAQKLKEKEPCPVCGSLEHPTPAKFSGKEIKKEELDALKDIVTIAREKRESASKIISENAAVLTEKEKLYAEKKEEIKSVLSEKNISVSEDITVEYLRKIYTDLKRELSKKQAVLQKEEDTEKAAKDFITSSEKKQIEFDKTNETLNEKHIELTQKISALNGKYETLEKTKIFASKDEANNALTEGTEKQKSMDKNLKTLRKKKDEIKSQFDACETLIYEYKNTLPKEENEAKILKENYDVLKEKYDLSEEEWQNIIAKHKKEYSGELEEKIKKFESEKSKLEGSVSTLKIKTENKTYPDLEKFKNILDEKEKTLFDKEEKLNSLKENFSNNQNAFESLKNEKNSREKILSLYQIYDNLSNKLSSNSSGGYLDIETFVQRYYLTEILSCANKRLYAMTDGEFELRLAGDKEANELKNRGGLDFMIHSFITGKDRQIRTLSGGESFLTALSLSLGMADSIERRSVAVSPDILFIDEGFGSLDNNARKEAVNVLKSVAGKNRMIAVISHVSELKQELETRLVVKKDAEGSFVKWE